MQLFDQYGRPMKRPARRDLEEELAAPSLGTVRSIHTGHPAEGLTPQRLASILKQAETGDPTSYLELAEQMEEKDLHYAAVLGVRKRAVRALELQVEPAGPSAAEEDAAALVREVLDTAAMRLVLIDLLDSLGKGYSVAEIVWDTQGRQWVPRRIVHRDPRHFRPDLDTGQRLLLRSNAGEVELPPFKFVTHFATAKSGLPIRAGLARLAGWAYIFKNYSIRDWAIFMEAYGHPIRLGKYGPTATEADRATLLRAVRRIGTDLAAIVPHSMEVELVNGNVTGAGALYEDSARYWDEQLSKGVLGQVSTTDAIAGGHAVGRVHDAVRDDIRDADAEQLALTLQRDVAQPITVLNYGPSVGVPQISFAAPEDHDPRLLAIAAREFVPMGLKIPLSVVRERFGIPEPEDGDEVLTIPAPRAVPVRPEPDPEPGEDKTDAGDGTPEPPVAASRRSVAPDSLESMVDRIMADGTAAAATDLLLGGIVEAIAGAASLEEVRDILDQVVRDAPDASLRELIAQVLFAGRLAGETGADIGR